MNSKVFGVAEFKYGKKNFKGAKGLPWQPNMGNNKPKLH